MEKIQNDMSISELTGLLGLIFGLIGTSISSSNYLRNKAKIIVLLQLNMDIDPPFAKVCFWPILPVQA